MDEHCVYVCSLWDDVMSDYKSLSDIDPSQTWGGFLRWFLIALFRVIGYMGYTIQWFFIYIESNNI